MKKITFALALAVSLGTTAVFAHNGPAAQQRQRLDAQTATDGAFRDGLYLGRRAAESQQPLRPPVGRWSSDRDRSSFVAGYRRGYEDARGAS
jgi:hypothetical protein